MRNGFGKGMNEEGTAPRLPSFFIVGPPRTASSWLYGILSECAWLSYPTKETRFFDKHFDRGLAWYQAHYRKVHDGRIIGEIAPTYFASPVARERIARLIPSARVVCSFRNPVDRVVSLHRLKRAYGLIPWSLEEALTRDPELIESSRYATHLKGWRHAFGNSQVLVTMHEDIVCDAQKHLDQLADFLGLDRITLLPSDLRPVLNSDAMTEPRHYYCTRVAVLLSEWAKSCGFDSSVAFAKRLGALKLFIGSGTRFADPLPSLRIKLRELFRPEVEELERLLNRDLSAWK